MRWALLVVLGLAVGGIGCSHMHHKESDEGDEVKMSFSDTPAPVQATLTREAGGATITSVDREEKNGKTVYETDVQSNGKTWEIRVAPDGKLLSKKVEKPEDEKEEKEEHERK